MSFLVKKCQLKKKLKKSRQKKNRHTRLQMDNGFQLTKIKDLNDKFNVTMFTTSLRGGKAFAAEQKII